MFSCNQVTQLLQITLPPLADFSDQPGAIFRFGPKTNNDTGTTLKVEGVSHAIRRKLVNPQIHNLNKEQNVRPINYEISICGKQCLEVALKKMIIKKSSDILDQADTSDKKILKTSKGDKGNY